MGIKSDIIKELTKRFDSGALDMSQAARFTRAREQGFNVDTPLFHGTAADINAFDPAKLGSSTESFSANQGVWLSSSPDTARSYAEYAAKDVPVRAKLREADAAEARGDWDAYDKALVDAEDLEQAIYNEPRRGQNILQLTAKGKMMEIDADGAEFMDIQDDINSAIRSAKAQGFEGVTFKNLSDDVGGYSKPSDHTIVFDPANIRSTNAAFDPAKSTSSNLLASSPIAAIGGAGLASQTEQGQQTINAIIEELRGRGAAGLITPQEALRLGGGDVGGIEARSIRAPSIFGPILDAIDRASQVELPIIGKPLEGVGEFVRDIGFKNTTTGKIKKAAGAALDLI